MSQIAKTLSWLMLVHVSFVSLVGCGTYVATMLNNSSLEKEKEIPPPLVFPAELPGSTYLEVGKSFACDSAATAAAEKTMRPLSKRELVKSLNSVFGTSLAGIPSVAGAIRALPFDYEGPKRVESFDSKISNLNTVLDLAIAVGEAVASDTARLNQLLPGCNGGGAMSTCVNQLINRLGKQIYRRPLTTAESTDIKNVVTDLGNNTFALGAAISRMLASPFFHQLYLGASTEAINGRIRLTPYEIASRISYGLTAAPPDPQLIAAADNNKLSTVAEVQAQVQRIVETPEAREHIRFMIKNWIGADPSDPNEETGLYRGIATAGLGKELDAELDDFINYVVFEKNGSLNDLYLDPTTFPKTSRVSKIYNVSQSNSALPFSDGRGGILLRPSMHKQFDVVTSPIYRGVRFRKKVLCSNLPDPDISVISQRPPLSPEVNHETLANRFVVTEITRAQSCQGCHGLINPIGFVFEQFGPLGEVREMEPVFDSKGNFIKAHAIDTRVDKMIIPGKPISAVNNAIDMIHQIADAESSKRCFSQQLFRETRLRNALSSDGCTLNLMSEKLIQGGSVKEAIMLNFANPDIFWRVL